jgi:ADP-dependent NAD(P)H-hydrate dehydratase / NAD(P)H-hydrate epimerase
MKLVSTAQMRTLEKTADELGLSYSSMMENAGRAVADAIAERYDRGGRPVLVLVGPGNNGGDGLVVARLLKEMDYAPTVYIWKRKLEGDPNLRRVEELSLPIVWAERDVKLKRLRMLLAANPLVVDALLGTGASRPIEGLLAEMLNVVGAARQESETGADEPACSVDEPVCAPANRLAHPAAIPQPLPMSASRLPVVAVDVPSGLDCDTGVADPATLQADVTVTFAHPKVGQFTPSACSVTGEIVVADIEIPAVLAEDIPTDVMTPDLVARLLPARPRCSHKGTFGKALIIAGSVNYTGAAVLAATAATRAGAGLVTLGIARSLHSAIAANISEATYLLLPNEQGVLNADAVRLVLEKLTDYEALLVGPGLSSEEEAVEFVHELVGVRSSARKSHIGFRESVDGEGKSNSTKWPPLVVDADGLNALATAARWWTHLPPQSILTPHPGELSRLLDRPVKEIEAARLETAREAALMWGHIVVLKGAYTVVAAPDGRAAVSPFANPALASAGTGDVLAGTIVALLAQRAEPWAAAVAGVYLHAMSGELVRREIGVAGGVASDVAQRLPAAMRLLRGE